MKRYGCLLVLCEVMGFVLTFSKYFGVLEISWALATAPFWMPLLFLGIYFIIKRIERGK